MDGSVSHSVERRACSSGWFRVYSDAEACDENGSTGGDTRFTSGFCQGVNWSLLTVTSIRPSWGARARGLGAGSGVGLELVIGSGSRLRSGSGLQQ